MATYSFADVDATIVGAGGAINLGAGAGNSEEGITIALAEDRNVMRMGADGEGMHTLRAPKHGTITVRLLKNSPVNAQLTALYNAQSIASDLWGANVITVRNHRSGDVIAARECAFQKMPDVNFAQDGDMLEWAFHTLKIDPVLGDYA
jgi:hypothetical protein